MMERAISRADANRNFSTLLGTVGADHSYVLTPHGKIVARIVPAQKDVARGARAALVKRLYAQPVVRMGRWSRDELHQDCSL
jgi:antitoxin (DNA-binding transcriptional repressor) of toxin-antitoxin stability system